MLNSPKSTRLPKHTIELLAPFFVGLDLHDVRIYTKIPAIIRRFARIEPVAITLGKRIYFAHAGHGGYDTDSLAGLELIAHELTHVQQFARYKTPAGFGFKYISEYQRHRSSGLSEKDAYLSISHEIEAVKNAAKIRLAIEKQINSATRPVPQSQHAGIAETRIVR